MELSYFISALRRRWWLPLVGAFLGLVFGSLVSSPGVAVYEARAVLFVAPPSNNLGQTVVLNDPDRYVIGQLEVLRSSTLAAEVATIVPGNETPASIGKALTVLHEAKTDIVVVKVRSSDPANAERIANTFADTYIGGLKDRATKQQKPQVDEFNKRLAEVQTKLVTTGKRATDAQSQLSIANISLAQPANDELATTPSAERRAELRRLEVERQNALHLQADAAAAAFATAEAERQSLFVEYTSLNQSKTELELAANQKVVSEVIQPAVLPRLPVTKSAKLWPAVALVLGSMLGAFAAVAWARLSGRFLDRAELEAALKGPIVGELRKDEALSRDLEALLQTVPTSHVELVDQLCVRSEALARSTTTLTVAVVGTRRPAVTTALAVAMASRFAEMGASVILVDADDERAAITHGFRATENGGIPALIARMKARDESEAGLAAVGGRSSRSRGTGKVEPALDAFSNSPVGDVMILGLGPKAGRQPLRRNDVANILAGASAQANVIVIDGGAMLDSASTVQLTREVDAVVLAIPLAYQQAGDLGVVMEQLEGLRKDRRLLPVVTNPGRRSREVSN